MSRLFLNLSLVICYLGLGSVSHAQDKGVIKAELITLSWHGNIKDLWFMSQEGPRKLDVYERDFTSPESYAGLPEILFYDKKEALALPPEDRPKPKAIAKLPANGGELLLIFTPKEPAADGWDIRTINNSSTSFPPGGYRVMNLTPEPLQIALDKKITPVAGNSAAIIRPDRGDDIRDMLAQVAADNKIAFSSIWGHREDRRTTVFIFGDVKSVNGLNIRRFYEAVIAQKPSP